MHILLFDDLYYLHVAVFVYKVFHEMHRAVTVNLFTKLSSVYSLKVTRRVNNDYFLLRVRLDVCKRFITFQGANIWSKIDINTNFAIICINLNIV